MDTIVVKDGKCLRRGYTTGTCAAAASKAAAWMLLTGRRLERISVTTPNGTKLELPLREISLGPGKAKCAIEKYSGDDPDVTNGKLIFAEVSLTASPGISIDGGEGVGRVTRAGLNQPIGAAAINSVPRRMILEGVEEVCRLTDHRGGMSVLISVPGGKELAKKTFNPRLGIEGGISILGTTGIVEPMSEKAVTDTISLELGQRRASGAEYVLITPGNYGAEFIRSSLGLDPELPVLCSNFIGDTLDMCAEKGFCGVILVGHIGKLVKLAGGIMNTHSKYGDCRMEILAAHSGAAGLSPESIERILACATCDGALEILEAGGLTGKVMSRLTDKIHSVLTERWGNKLETGLIIFSRKFGLLSRTENAAKLLEKISED